MEEHGHYIFGVITVFFCPLTVLMAGLLTGLYTHVLRIDQDITLNQAGIWAL